MTDSDSGPDVLGQVTDELMERCRRGERPALTDYLGRYPALADELRALFSALVLMEDVRPSPPAAAEGPPLDRAGAVPCRQLGEYRLVREIGRGGMGVVYEAEQESLGRRVALKVLPPEAVRDPRYLQRFQREARAAARLHHTHIVPVFGVGEDQGTHYYVMQYIEGRPLDEVLAELRRLRAGAAPEGGPAPDRAAADVGARAGPYPSAEAGPPSSVEVARSLWEGRFRAAPPPDAAAAMAPDGVSGPEAVAGPPAPQTPCPAAASTGSASTSGPLSDPHRPYAKSVASIGIQVAEALEYAAQQGVLHRDVKPSNLLLDVWGNVWLTDFGLAKATGTPDLTRTGDLLGTLRYMAPERFQGQADVRSDVYALGLTLYEALALRPAFDESGQMELMQQISAAEPPRLDQLNPQLPRDLVMVVHKAMTKDPGDRYQTAGALAEDLGRFLDDRPIVARRLGVLERAWRWTRRNPTLAGMLAALLALAVLATGGGVWLVQQQAERRAEAARHAAELRTEVGTALDQATTFRKSFHFRAARELLEQARRRLEPAGPDDLRQQLDGARADLDLVEHLDAARFQTAAMRDGKYDFTGAERRYAAAFAEAGLGREGDDLEALAARVQHSAVRAEIVGALEDWASLTKDRARRAWLLAAARAADPHPSRNLLRQPELWRDGARLERLAQEMGMAELSLPLATALGRALRMSGGDAIPLMKAAQARFRNDFWLNFQLGQFSYDAKRPDDAVGYYRTALALRPETSAAYHTLGIVLYMTGQLDEAIDCYQQTLRLDSKDAVAYSNLGLALYDTGRLDEAIDCYQQALRLDPKDALAHSNLGLALYHKGRLDEAIGHHQQALRLAPNLAPAHTNFGITLHAKGQLDAAIAHHQQAVRLDPESAKTHTNLGLVLQARGQLDEAIRHGQQAVRLDPKLAEAHYNLGLALHVKGRLDEAIAEYREAIRLAPKLAQAHCNLGHALQSQGHFAEAVACLKRGHELGSKTPNWPYPSEQWLKQAERLAAQHDRLSAVLQGKYKPANAAESLEFAQLCLATKRYAAAVRLHADAFAADPKLADDVQAGYRYNAACAAALAASRHGAEADALGDAERAHLRRQALEWLTADLVAWANLIKNRPQDQARAQETLRHWKADTDLAGLRDAERLAALAPEEQEACRKLWAAVDALLQQAQKE
jgi:serine/threonine protein kinase/Flp pilus assembly protein TadD